jgi:glc operon protein GlcG
MTTTDVTGKDDHPATSAPAPGPPPPYGPPIPLETAKRVMAAAEAEALANGWPMVIAIFDSAGQLVLLHRLDQANLGAVDLAQRKAQTAVRFRRPTKVYEDIIVAGGAGLRLLSAASDLIALEGGVPLLQGGAVVGSIGVSGMQSSQDGQVARAGARVLQG